jgi:hypothetical protein
MDPHDATNTNMTQGDAMAELERTLPKLDVTPKTFYETKARLLAPGYRVIAVSSKVIGDNAFSSGFNKYRPVIEVWDLPENGDMIEATLLGVFRHVEVLGASWIHHDPENALQGVARRGSVLATKSALRLFEDTEQQMKVLNELPVRHGC